MMRYSEASMTYLSLAQMTEIKMNSYIGERIIGSFCHDKKMLMNQTETQSCNVSMVMECSKTADIPHKIKTSVFYGWEPVCQ